MTEPIDIESLEKLVDELVQAGALAGPVTEAEGRPAGLAFLLPRLDPERLKEILDRVDITVPLSADGLETLERLKEIVEENRRLKTISNVDELTGLYNSRYFRDRLEVEMQRVRRTEKACSLIMMDLDGFKPVNDTYGHQAGDRLLARIGELILEEARAVDVAARYGGDEFAIILPDTGILPGAKLAERVRARLHEDELTSGHGVTGSFGLASHHYFDDEDAAGLVERADQALYQAKNRGGDQVWFSEQDLAKVKPTEVTVDERGDLFAALALPVGEE